MSRLGVVLMRCLAWLPLPVLRALGAFLGWVLYAFALRRRRVGDINLAIAFPRPAPASVGNGSGRTLWHLHRPGWTVHGCGMPQPRW